MDFPSIPINVTRLSNFPFFADAKCCHSCAVRFLTKTNRRVVQCQLSASLRALIRFLFLALSQRWAASDGTEIRNPKRISVLTRTGAEIGICSPCLINLFSTKRWGCYSTRYIIVSANILDSPDRQMAISYSDTHAAEITTPSRRGKLSGVWVIFGLSNSVNKTRICSKGRRRVTR
jgi:hypothetical protein